MGDHQNRLPVAAGGAGKQRNHVLTVFAVQISRGLVGQNQLWLCDKGAAYGDTLLLAAGKLIRQMLPAVGEIQEFQNFLDF